VSNLIFGAAAHTLPPAAGDKLPIFDSVGSTVRSISFTNLIGGATGVGTIDGAENFVVLTGAGALRRMNLASIASNATAVTAANGVDNFPIVQGGVLKRILLSDIIDKQSAVTTLGGAENMIQSDGAGTSRRITTSNLKKYIHAGYALYRDEKAQNTAGGTLTAGSWQTRTLNTESVDTTISGASVATNKVTLPIGTYRFRGSAPFYRVGNCQVRLQNTTDAATVAVGESMNSGNSATGAVVRSEVTGRVTIAAPKEFELQYQIGASVGTSDGGVPSNFTTEVYSTLEFWQED
jgi:hypothetical protein